MYEKVIVIGILISLIYYEITGISPGGLIVPAYIAININNPQKILATLFLSLITLVILNLASKFMIIYGKRQFALAIAIALILPYFISPMLPFSFAVIGKIIPGLIANEWKKEGIIRSTISLAMVSGIIVLIMLIMDVPLF